jgi:hypothetical protein
MAVERERKKGLALPTGYTEEPRSYRKCSKVVSADEHAPPKIALRSKIVGLIPAEANTIAAAKPFGPEPIIVAVLKSYSDATDP